MNLPLLVVIPTHNRPKLVTRTLDSLCKCLLPESYLGTVVIENGTKTADLERYVTEADVKYRLCYRHTPVANKSEALNSVVLDSQEDCLMTFFDDDVIIHPYTLVAYAVAFKKRPEAAYFGGPVFSDFEGPPPPAWLRHYLPPSVLGWSLGPELVVVRGAAFMGANWAARQSALHQAGLFDPSVGPGGTSGARGQETTMQRALSKCGALGMYVPDAIVWHHIPDERCSPDWAIKRTYALNKARSKGASKGTLWSAGKNYLLETARLVSFALMLFLIGPFLSEHKRFWLRFRLQSSLGYLSGLHLRIAQRRQNP